MGRSETPAKYVARQADGTPLVDVALTREALTRFFVDSESTYPVTSWTAAMAALAMRSSRYKSVFISHSTHDADFAVRLKDMLEEGGVRCWIDREDAMAGSALPDTLRVGIERADVLVVCCSEQAARSEWVRLELDVAKRTALALLTMKAGRQVRIQVHADNSPAPRRTILVDSIAALRPEPMSAAVAPAE